MPVLSSNSEQPIVFVASTALDLFWALVALGDRPELRSESPVLSAIDDKELVDRVCSFWDDGAADWSELLVLASHAGVLEGLLPADEFMAGVETACTTVALEPPLRTESEHDRQVIWRRLGVLSSDKASRRRYLALLSDVLSTIETRWGPSEAASMATAGRCAERASQGSAWRTLVDGGPNLDECLMTAREHLSRTDRLVVGISAFGKSVILDLPGAQLIGLRMVESASDARERSVALARRLKALADPTRLALLRLISESPQGVGSLARDLDLAQPTVSNHVKVLRESGLVRSMPSGGRHQLATDDDAIRKLLAETASLLEVSVP